MLAAPLRSLVIAAVVGLISTINSCTGGESTPLQPSEGYDGSGTVTSITDGDTLRLEVDGLELRVRLLGIDSPEVYPDVECYGPEAEAALAALAPPGAELSFAYDRDPRDQYDRELLYLYTAQGTFINYELVAQGYAEAVLFEPNDRFWNDLRAVEDEAREAELGLWSACP